LAVAGAPISRDDPRDDDPPEVAVFCPRCAEREFGSFGQLSDSFGEAVAQNDARERRVVYQARARSSNRRSSAFADRAFDSLTKRLARPDLVK
jgi:hypothetical protein